MKKSPTKYNFRKFSGKRAQKSGAEFEDFLQNHSDQNILVQRIPNGVKIVRKGSRLIPLLIKSPYDFVIFSNLKTVAADAKSIEGNTFPKSCIDTSQMDTLVKTQPHVHRAGYIIFFKSENRICFYSATELRNLERGESLKPNEGLFLGTRWNLNLLKLFD